MARTSSTERMPEEEVHITRPSWSKPEVKRLGKDNFFKEEENVFLESIIKAIVVRCCWAFTSTEAITAAYALKNKREIVSLSKQQLIDCMYTKYKKPSYFADLGEKECFPCSYNKAYKFVMDYGITVETKYPFMEERGKCECQSEMGVYMGPTENEIAQVKQKETEGQVVGKHAMLIVGYGEEEGVEFYLVKNSWGTEWDYQGYAKIKRSALSKLSYPIID
ncbi:hypothetical protein KY289_017380 [Solanum tuberosum]|nr:hypothetical protein KY289_017380 [Solanum tuberosum]